ncbi:hypothetical protein [Metabacillus litoralis]|uniref:hypothetical protein n=1 Tax=Metabacillus litoralis TaxID=152268 RepID=UPI00203C4DD3|nr:hypothetical protein [Metabacillus litoralis]MCM3413240.1 hypothetical protein [Metabacillus litoralis]
MLFHYHFWTPYVEKTEKFYLDNGFRISQRIGKYNGDFQAFNPPLTWDDFRGKKILFRIIEARKGAVNITFGFGKKIMFDHIGFLVSEEEQGNICENAAKMNWEVDKGERRTFITTPYNFRIELQVNEDAIDSMTDNIKIEELKLETKMKGLNNDLSILFNKPINSIISEVGDEVTIKEALIKGFLSSNIVDPNGVRISNNT